MRLTCRGSGSMGSFSMGRSLAIFSLLALLLSHCSPIPGPGDEQQQNRPPTVAVSLASDHPTAVTAPAGAPARPPQFLQRSIDGITFTGVKFDARSHQVVIADQTKGPGSRFSKAADAAASRNGLAAINGGFFTPEGKPLGMVIAGGQQAGHWNRASSLGSGVLVEREGMLSLLRRTQVDPKALNGVSQLLQSGPFLVDAAKPVSGLNATKRRPRSLIAWNGNDGWWIGTASSCSLDALAKALSRQSPASWKVHRALNLDGGSSCELWVSEKITTGRPYQSRIWPRAVRNYLVLIPRP